MKNKITKIEIQKNNSNKMNIYINEKFSFSCSVNFYLDNKKIFYKDNILTDDELNSIKEKSMPEEAFSYLLYLTKYAKNSEFMMKRKLKNKGFSDKAIEYAIQKAKDTHFLDDNEIIDRIIETAVIKKYGINKIKEKLYTKGIKITDDILNHIDEEIPFEMFCDLAKANAENKIKILSKKKDINIKNKLYSYLTGQGFTNDVISHVMCILFDNNDM